MATINIGNLAFNHKGDYASGTAYVKNDVVYYSTNGNAYIAKQATTGNAPTNATYWNQFAQGSGGIWNAGLSLGSANQIVQVNSAGNALEFAAKPQGSTEILANQALDSTGVSAIQLDIDWATRTDLLYVDMNLGYRGSSNSNSNGLEGFFRNASGNITGSYWKAGRSSYRQEDGSSNTHGASNSGSGYGDTALDLNGWGTDTNSHQSIYVRLYRPNPDNNRQVCDYSYKLWDYTTPVNTKQYYVFYNKIAGSNDTSVKTGFRIEATNSHNMTRGWFVAHGVKRS